MNHSTQPKTWVRLVNALLAMAVAAAVAGNYPRVIKVVELERASLGIQAEWIGGHGKQMNGVTLGGPADRAGIRAGDVLQFDPYRGREAACDDAYAKARSESSIFCTQG
jgi:hypothetical protein